MAFTPTIHAIKLIDTQAMSTHTAPTSPESTSKLSSTDEPLVSTYTGPRQRLAVRVLPHVLQLVWSVGFFLVAIAPVAAQASPTPTPGAGAGGSAFLQVACDAGLGELFTFVLTGVAVYVIVKGIITAVIGLDKGRSKASGAKRKQGREALKDGARQVAGGVFLPPMLLGALNAMGVSLGCLTPTLGI